MSDLLSRLMTALDLDAQGNWDEAHQIVQKIEDPRAYWIHAYLHRKEGDLGNASYWYRRADQSIAKGSLADEWQTIYDAIRE
jgi:hypothetical protein